MTYAIIAGLIGLLAGFGAAQIGDTPMTELPMRGQGAQMQQRHEPLADDFVSARPLITSLPVEALSETERASLIFMREEEKLARDVYTTLYETWQLHIFSNIAQSEQTHTEAVRQLLVKYEIADPVTDDTVGVFTDDTLQALYTELITTGNASEVAALRVGALIEDLDIADLEKTLTETDNQDITTVYENLARGSRNHLRSFVRQLTAAGESYEPTHIDEATYASIIAAEPERGTGRGWGGGQGQSQGQGQGRSGGTQGNGGRGGQNQGY